MAGVTFKRILRSGYLSFKRNGWLSTATILIMVLMLFVFGSLIFLGALANTILSSFENKVDISLYFIPDAQEEKILEVKREIESRSDVKEVSYTSKERALEVFKERHRGNPLINQALEELGDNPLQASLNIRAKDPINYASISEFVLNQNYRSVEKINYFENQALIERMVAIFKTLRRSGTILALLLAFIAVLVAFNTIRLAIYTMREEIGIMRLVGANKWFIRGPFLVNGILYGGISAIITVATFFPLVWFVAPKLSLLVPEFDIFNYFLQNLVEFAVIMFLAGVMLGGISSLIAIRRYLGI